MLDIAKKWFTKIAYYFLTLDCTSHCEYCDIWRDRKFDAVDGITDTGTILDNLAALKKMRVGTVEFSGGEPLLRPDLPEILRAAKAAGLEVILTTDGTLYPERAPELKGLVDILLVSLDSPSAAEHNRIRGNDSFSLALTSLRLARHDRSVPVIQFTLTRESITLLPEMVELAEAEGLLLRPSPVFGYFGLQGFTRSSLDYIRRYQSHPRVLLDLAILKFIGQGGNHTRHPRCRAADSTLTILPTGEVAAPCLFNQERRFPINDGIAHKAEVQAAQGRREICEACIVWWYLAPSFSRKLDGYFFLNLWSHLVNGLKIKKYKQEANKP